MPTPSGISKPFLDAHTQCPLKNHAVRGKGLVHVLKPINMTMKWHKPDQNWGSLYHVVAHGSPSFINCQDATPPALGASDARLIRLPKNSTVQPCTAFASRKPG